MVRGLQGGGGRKRQERRLPDFPAREDDKSVKKYLHGRVKKAELDDYRLPTIFEIEEPQVVQRNRGLVTIYNKMGQLRRRFYKLMIEGRQGSKEGNFIKDKLKVFLKEVKILQDQVKKLRGVDGYFKMPPVLAEDLVLLK